jgi:hypothetical protein
MGLPTTILSENMGSEEDEKELIQAGNDLQVFIKSLAKKYPQLFKNRYCRMKIHPSMQHPFFPYEVSLEIKIEE